MAFERNTLAGDGVASIKRCRRDQYSDGVRILATALGRGRLKKDIESSTWRRRQEHKATPSRRSGIDVSGALLHNIIAQDMRERPLNVSFEK
nr:hypothetical protein [Tanacetum cinerariifolium]